MGLYDVVLGDGHQAERGALLLPLVEIEDAGRYRDCWIERWPDGLVFAVYTRNGGPNRKEYAGVIKELQANSLYIRDADDSFDNTYATFYFRLPDWVKQTKNTLASMAVAPVDMSARWKEAMERVQRGELRPSEIAMADQLFAGIKDDTQDGVRIIEI